MTDGRKLIYSNSRKNSELFIDFAWQFSHCESSELPEVFIADYDCRFRRNTENLDQKSELLNLRIPLDFHDM